MTMTTLSVSVARIAMLVAGIGLLGACMQTAAQPAKPVYRAQPSPEGRLTVMAGAPNFDLNAPPADWIIEGGQTGAPLPLKRIQRDGRPALELQSGPGRIIAVRQVDAMMLATPYLSWSWHLSNHGEGIHPVRLVIGFSGGSGQNAPVAAQGATLPHHDRAISLVWGDTALRRGALSLPPAERPHQTPVYTVRGGRENTRIWWKEIVDLSDLYAKSWPQDTRKNVRIAFIGLAAAPTQAPVHGRVSGILLTH